MKPIYAIELDDSTHDTDRRRARDHGVDQMLSDAGLALIHYRDVGTLTDEEIIQKFKKL